ncbi:peptidoglycan editing factor PgeF [Sphingorhabdus sp. Alg239-R122]|uniref:peptidoglycan editing factor PgeF n=1 Tax=Sphingorhabdus sp. Alg239-R122 TaxID=2305989 RepID=UPI0013D92A79|nr:peptidoglycan editing factor PgeF [Sphingorhabdus sp. Alg239-R122]
MPLAPEILRSDMLGDVPHGFLGRSGGVSEGIYAGLNVGLGSDDGRDAIMENRRIARDAVLPGAELVMMHQVHSPDAVTVTEAIPVDARPHADAMVTNRPGLLLGILTADCVPVLFHDTKAGVAGAAHAGWKGALGGVTDSTLDAMEKLGANRANIACAIGPCIAQKSYEVDEGFMRRFIEADVINERFFGAGKPGHYQFDIEGYVAARLAAAGVTRVDLLGQDTYSQPDRFYSYRRSCHKNEPGYGRQVSLIGIRG